MKTREAKVGKAVIRMAETKTGFGGIVLLDGADPVRLDDQNPERLWERLHQEAGKLNPNFVGYDGARARFLRIFPGGFMSEIYLGDEKVGERNYKLRARNRLDELVPLEQARGAQGVGEAISAVFQSTNLLSHSRKCGFVTRFEDETPTPSSRPLLNSLSVIGGKALRLWQAR